MKFLIRNSDNVLLQKNMAKSLTSNRRKNLHVGIGYMMDPLSDLRRTKGKLSTTPLRGT